MDCKSIIVEGVSIGGCGLAMGELSKVDLSIVCVAVVVGWKTCDVCRGRGRAKTKNPKAKKDAHGLAECPQCRGSTVYGSDLKQGCGFSIKLCLHGLRPCIVCEGIYFQTDLASILKASE